MTDDFDAWLDGFLAATFRLDPVMATHVGNHDHDDRWPDWSAAGHRARLAYLDRWQGEVESLGAAGLGESAIVDVDVLRGVLAADRWHTEVFREEAWNPLAWVYLLGDGLFGLLSREFAPLADRLASVAGRLEGLPAVVDAAVEVIGSAPGVPASRLHTEVALRDAGGVGELIAEALETAHGAAAGDAAAGDAAVAGVVARLEAAAETARAALARFEDHLRQRVLPAAEGDGRLGRERFEARLRHTLQSERPSPAEVVAAAERQYHAIRAEMVRLARGLWPTWLPERPLPTAASEGSAAAAEQAIVRGVIDAIAADHPAAGELLDVCRAELRRIEQFCRDRGLIEPPDEPLEIQWTPVFLRSFGGAMLSSPGPLDRGLTAFFSITPAPDDWSPEQVESYLREDNRRQLQLLTIHEAVPGHYLQGVHANRSTSLVRSIFGSGLYAEGWAVYVTQVMIDAGYAADDPALELVHWKFYLRAAINALLDHRIHVDGIDTAAAVRLMIEGGFQEEAEALKKDERARLTSGQLSTYFVGAMEFWAIEREVRRRAAAASGDPRGAAAVPERDLPGGFGETPGFVYRDHLLSVLAHGEPPTSILRRIVLGEP